MLQDIYIVDTVDAFTVSVRHAPNGPIEKDWNSRRVPRGELDQVLDSLGVDQADRLELIGGNWYPLRQGGPPEKWTCSPAPLGYLEIAREEPGGSFRVRNRREAELLAKQYGAMLIEK